MLACLPLSLYNSSGNGSIMSTTNSCLWFKKTYKLIPLKMRLQTSTEYMVLNMSHITKIHDYSDVHCNKRIVTATSLCPQSCPTVI